MIQPAVTSLIRPSKAVIKYSVGLFYGQWTHRYLLYLAACLLIGVWTYVGLEIYGRLTFRVTSISFRGNYILHTMMNFGLCLYVTDEWLVRLTGRWGRFENRTLGKQALIWGLSFVAAFHVQRTIVFEGIMYYALDLYHFYEKYPQLRPRPLEHFLFCLPFFIATVLLLWLMAFVRQRGLQKERKAMASLKQALAAKEEVQRAKAPNVPGEEAGRDIPPLYVQSGSSEIILEQDSISHVTVEDHYCRIHTLEEGESKSYFVKSSLADLLKKLSDSHFVQIHRSHVINARVVRRLEKKSRVCRVYLNPSVVLPVSRHRLNEVGARIREALELREKEK